MKLKHISALLLCTAAVLACFGGCSHDTPPAETGTGTAAVASATAEAPVTRAEEEDDLPFDLNFNGEELTLLCWSEKSDREWGLTDRGTDGSLQRALYEKTAKVETRLNVKVNAVTATGDWTGRKTFLAAVQADDNGPDLVLQNSAVVGTVAAQGCYADLNRAEHLNPEKPWWPGNQKSALSIGGKLYAVLGDASVTIREETQCILENADLLSETDAKSPDAAVGSGAWTAELLLQILQEAELPRNPDGTTAYKVTLSQDTACDAMIYGGGYVFAENNNGTLSLSPALSAADYAAWFSLWSDFTRRNDLKTLPPSGTDGFASGNVLFHFCTLGDVRTYLPGTGFRISVLPYPKQTAEQTDYCTVCTANVTAFSISARAKNPALAGAVLEAAGSYGYQVQSPAYLAALTANPRLDSAFNKGTFGLLHRTLAFDAVRMYAETTDCTSVFRRMTVTTGGWEPIYNNNHTYWEAMVGEIMQKLS